MIGRLVFSTMRLGKDGSQSINDVGFSKNKTYLLISQGHFNQDFRITIWKIREGTLIFDSDKNIDFLNISISGDSIDCQGLFGLNRDRAVIISYGFALFINLETGNVIKKVSGLPKRRIKQLGWLPDESLAITYEPDLLFKDEEQLILEKDANEFKRSNQIRLNYFNDKGYYPITSYGKRRIKVSSDLGLQDFLETKSKIYIDLFDNQEQIASFPAASMITYYGLLEGGNKIIAGDAIGQTYILNIEENQTEVKMLH
jgi:hypothetical protein